jgi:ribosome-associated translation inhibitor RaiA
MATIEKRPLPPPNGTVTTITEAHRAEISAQANDVLDYYLNGAGSYFEGGTQKPLISDFGDSTVQDLKRFKQYAIGAKAFADDPNSIIDSVIDNIDRTIERVEQAARNNEARDRILRAHPDTVDPIDVPRVISPRSLSGAPELISFPPEAEPLVQESRAGATDNNLNSEPVRILSRRIVDRSPASVFDTSAPAVSSRNTPEPQSSRPLGIFGGKPMPNSPAPPPIWNLPAGGGPKPGAFRLGLPSTPVALLPASTPEFIGGLAGRLAALAGIDPNNPDQTAPPAGGLLGLLLRGQRQA